MAIVGEASIVVRAIGTRVKSDITDIFKGLDRVGGGAGANFGKKFSDGFNKSGATNSVGKLADGLRRMYPEAERAREAWQKLVKTGFVLGPTITGLVGSISALIGSFVSIAGAAGAAGASLVVLGNIMSAMGLAMLSAKIALGGVMQALGAMGKGGGAAAKNTDAIRAAQERLAMVIEGNQEALINANKSVTDAQNNLNDAFAAGREELQQLGFAAEEAALAELGAGLDLERAREQLARVQDLPPNSRIRREAELAFAQAELQYREAIDTNADLAAEQEKYAESGIEGTEQVIRAREELAEAEANLARVVRDGLRQQIEAERALAEARKQSTAGGGADPFEGLTQSQKEFVKEVYKLKPLFEAVQEQVAKAFLPLLSGAITTFATKVLPSIGDGLAKIAGELGKASVRFADFLASAEGMELVNTFFDNSAKLIRPMADAFGLLMQIFIRLMNAAAPVAERFVNWIVEGFENFNNYLKDLDKDGSLAQFFKDAGDAAAEFGAYFGEVFRLIGQIIGANLGEGSPGREMVVWLTDGLRAANDLRDGVGASGLKDYFAAVNENVKPMLEFLGQMGRILIDMGANPAIGQVFEILKQAEPSIRKIAIALLEAGPSIAELVVQLLRIFAAFTDTGQITAFFDTLTKIATVVADVVEQAWFQKLLEQIGPLLATFLALQTVLNVVKFGFMVLIGSLIGLLTVAAPLVSIFKLLSGGFTTLPVAIGKLPGPLKNIIGLVTRFTGIGAKLTGLVGLIVISFIDFVAKSEQFRKNFAGLFTSIGQIFSAIGSLFGEGSLLSPLLGFFELVGSVIGGVAGVVVAFFNTLSQVVYKVIAAVIGSFGKFNGPAVEFTRWFQEAAANVTAFFDFLIGGLNEFLGWVDGLLGLDSANNAVADSADGAATSLETTADAIDATGDAASSNTPEVEGFADGITALENSTVDAITANLDFKDSLKSLSSAISNSTSKVLDNSDAGRENKKALIEAARAVEAKLQADLDSKRPLEEVTARYKENYDALTQTAINAGLAEDKVDAFVARLLTAPKSLRTEFNIEVYMKNKTAVGLNQVMQSVRQAEMEIENAALGRTRDRATGGLTDYVKGIAFASGGISEGIYRSMARPLYKFAEPETGWEAFISGRKGSEERNRGIVREAASRLGMNMGGVSITVNPSPGMDERALAGAVSQEITKLMRKGSIY
jgi:hypothetical protein